MKTWIINQYAIFANETGSTRHYDFAKEMQVQGQEVKIITSDFNHYNHKKRDKFSAPGLDFEVFKVPSYEGNGVDRILNMLIFTTQLLKLIFYSKKKLPDTFIASSPHLFAPYIAMKIAKIRGIQFILEIRDIWPLSIIVLGNFKRSNPFIRVMTFLEKSLYKNADKIITLLPNSIDHISAIRGNAEGILWLPNGIKKDFLENLKKKEVKQSPEKRLIYAGSHGIANDIYSLLYALKIFNEQHPDNNLIVELIGQGREKESLIEYKQNNKIKNLIFTDAVPKNELFEKLEGADFFWVGSNKSELYQHGVSPNKLFDYMAVGRPILYSCDDGGPLIKRHDCGVIAEASNPLDMSNKLTELYNMNNEELERMGANGKKAAMEEYSIQTLTEKLINFI